MKKFTIDIKKLNFQKGHGLVTTVVQDNESGNVLMVGSQNCEAVEKTVKTGKVTFWSRTKERLWTKGESSGNFLEVVDTKTDCDHDAILYLVKAPKSTCHTGNFSCFGEKESTSFLTTLFNLIQSRKRTRPKDSYISKLFEKGLDRIAQKVGEEAIETVIAAKNKDPEAFINESADLLLHWMVLCAEKNITLSEIIECLEQRQG